MPVGVKDVKDKYVLPLNERQSGTHHTALRYTVVLYLNTTIVKNGRRFGNLRGPATLSWDTRLTWDGQGRASPVGITAEGRSRLTSDSKRRLLTKLVKPQAMSVDPQTGAMVADDTVMEQDAFGILIAGDLCPRNRTEPLILAGRSKEILADVLPILAGSSLSAVNLETPLTRAETPIPKSGPNLKVDPACLHIVTEAGFDVASCANNHIGDFGPQACLDTLACVRDHGIRTVGAGEDLADARRPAIVEQNGCRVAFLAFAENEFGGATRTAAGANPLHPLRNLQDIRAVCGEADITIVLIHGGNEHNPVPSPRMQSTYRAFAAAGASAVVAGHTHCPQGIEFWNGTPIIYSLGNFLFDEPAPGKNSNALWWVGYLVRLRFVGSRACGVDVFPYTFAPDATRIRAYQGAQRTGFLQYLDFLSQILQHAEATQRYWDAWCAIMGPRFIPLLSRLRDWPTDMTDEKQLSDLLVVRNLHTCEAHCELLTSYLRMAVEDRLEAAADYIPRIKDLQAGRIPGSDRGFLDPGIDPMTSDE